jgi:hypothetical protein
MEIEKWRSDGEFFLYLNLTISIMLIAVLAVKCKIKSYLGIHKLAVQYWEQIAESKDIPPISETQLRTRLKKICHQPGKPARFILQIFPPGYLD